jgi:outer membrane protein OmpA-like peptidoglycan-associated protein
MSRSHALIGAILCGALGLLDLGVLNLWFAPRAWPTVEARPEPKPDPAPGPKPEAKPEPKPEPEAKPEPKPEAKPEPKPEPEAKPEPKPEAKPAPKPEPEAKPEPKPEPEAKPEPKPEPEASPARARQTLVIRFETSSSALAPADEEKLRAMVRGRERSVRIVVEGHADSRGETDRNERLSWQRARAVVTVLEGLVPRARIQSRGLGSSRPLDPANTPEAWARNRRVEVQVRTEAAP